MKVKTAVSEMTRERFQEVFGDALKLDEPIARYTSARVGGSAEMFLAANSVSELRRAVELAYAQRIPYFILGGGYTLLHEGHVRMDSFYNRWSAKKKAVADLITFFLLAFYMVVFLLGGVPAATRAFNLGERSMTMWGPPLAPIKVIVTAAAVLLFLQVIAFAIRDVAIIRGRPIE